MCYHVSSPKIKSILDQNPRLAVNDHLDFEGFYHVSGFGRPQLPVTLRTSPNEVILGEWGFLPVWAKDRSGKPQLNTRSEDMFESKLFGTNAGKLRFGLLWIDGFFEPHYEPNQDKSVNYYIHMPEKKNFTLGVIYNEWVDKTSGEMVPTFSVLTCPPNERMRWVHNRPSSTKKTAGPEDERMPLIIDEKDHDRWLHASNICDTKQLLKPFPDGILLDFKSKLRPTAGRGDFNIPEVQEPALDPPDNIAPATLF